MHSFNTKQNVALVVMVTLVLLAKPLFCGTNGTYRSNPTSPKILFKTD